MILVDTSYVRKVYRWAYNITEEQALIATFWGNSQLALRRIDPDTLTEEQATGVQQAIATKAVALFVGAELAERRKDQALGYAQRMIESVTLPDELRIKYAPGESREEAMVLNVKELEALALQILNAVIPVKRVAPTFMGASR